MKIEKKLKRGLPDLSPLIGGHPKPMPLAGSHPVQFVANGRQCQVNGSTAGGRAMRAEECRAAERVKHQAPPHLVCTSFISFLDQPAVTQTLRLAEALEHTFEQVYFLALAPNQAQYETLRVALPITKWEDVAGRSEIYLEPVRTQFTFGYIPARAFAHICRPSFAPVCLSRQAAAQKSLAIVDAGQSDGAATGGALARGWFEFLDHCVLLVEADAAQLTRAYDWLRHSAGHHFSFQCALFLVGPGSEAHWEFVYERLSGMVSRFLTLELGFFGWMEAGKMRLNQDYLLEEARAAVPRSTKQRLSEALYACL